MKIEVLRSMAGVCPRISAFVMPGNRLPKHTRVMPSRASVVDGVKVRLAARGSHQGQQARSRPKQKLP